MKEMNNSRLRSFVYKSSDAKNSIEMHVLVYSMKTILDEVVKLLVLQIVQMLREQKFLFATCRILRHKMKRNHISFLPLLKRTWDASTNADRKTKCSWTAIWWRKVRTDVTKSSKANLILPMMFLIFLII